MRIANGALGPCTKCLNARNMLKRLAARAAGKQQLPFELITMTSGAQLVVETGTNEVRVTTPDAKDLLGIQLYHSKRYIFDLKTADRIDTYGTIAAVVGLTN